MMSPLPAKVVAHTRLLMSRPKASIRAPSVYGRTNAGSRGGKEYRPSIHNHFGLVLWIESGNRFIFNESRKV